MLHTKNTDQFISKHIDTCTSLELFKCYEYYYETFFGTDCEKKTSLFEYSAWYLIRFLVNNRPEDSFYELGKYNGHPTITREQIEGEYIFYMVRAAAIEEFLGKYDFAAYLAKKALEMVNYFHPHLNQAGKDKIIKEHPQYESAMAIYEDLKEHLTDEYCNSIELFDWEKKYYNPSTHANLNYTGLKLV